MRRLFMALIRDPNIPAMLRMLSMLLVRRMRNFAQVKLRKKNEYKGLNECNENAQRH